MRRPYDLLAAAAIAIAVTAVAVPASAEDIRWEFTAQVRPRLELRRGYRTLRGAYIPVDKYFRAEKAVLIFSQRTRLGLRFMHDPKVRAFVELQDVRLWGDELSTLDDSRADNLDVHEGYVDLKPLDRLTIRVGRQELDYDEGRILGSSDWSQQGRSHDAVRVMWDEPAWAVHAAWAHHEYGELLFSNQYWNTQNYQDLVMARLSRHWESGEIATLALFDSYDPTLPDHFRGVPKNRWTVGARAEIQRSRLETRAEAYYQTGLWKAYPLLRPSPSRRYDFDAFMVGVRAGYAIDFVTVTLWYDYLSGDRDSADDKYTAFDPPYPSNHQFYGWADHFVSFRGWADGSICCYSYTPSDTRDHGLQDLVLKTHFGELGPFDAQLDLHYFWYAQRDEQGQRALGFEADLMVTHPFSEEVDISAGYSHIQPAAAWERLKGGHGPGHWAWMMLAFNVQ
jgi:hypothetical protein